MKKVIDFIKAYKTTFIICFIAVVVAQCGGPKAATYTVDYFTPQASDASIAQTHWQGTSIDQLKQGYGLYTTECTKCHEMKNIQDFSLTDWPGIIEDMSRKAKLNADQHNLVSHYILARREAIASAKK